MSTPALVLVVLLVTSGGIIVAVDHRRMERRLDEAYRKLVTDRLTGLLNQVGVELVGEGRLADARQDGRHVAVLFLDLTKFKDVNDTYGHAAGDRLLRAVAQAFAPTVSYWGGVTGRLHGDEFAAVVPVPAGADEWWVDALAAVIDGWICTVTAPDGRPMFADVGAVLTSPTIPLDVLLQQADEAMYEAKEKQHPVLHALGQEERAA